MKKLILSKICFFIFVTSMFAQNLKSASSNSPAVVSDEVFKTIIQFYDYDKEIDLQPKIVATKEFSYGNREKIIFTGVNNSRVPSYLITPKDTTKIHPVVLIADGVYGSKERWFDDKSWPKGGLVTKALLDDGFAVMILDAVNHGERSAENDFAGPPLQHLIASRNMIMQTAIEYRRAIDYLETRSDIDVNRIGVMGLSLGGLITHQLASVDTRIKTAAAGVTPYITEPKLQAVSSITFASHISCDSYLVFVGNKDTYYTLDQAQSLYNRIPISKKEFIVYDSGHEPPIEYVKKVSDWFTKYL